VSNQNDRRREATQLYDSKATQSFHNSETTQSYNDSDTEP